jgi:hypothetical protein
MLKEDADGKPNLQPPTFNLQLFPLIGAAVLAGFTLAGLPWKDGLFRRPRTLFDRSAARAVAPGYALVAAAAPVVPAGATLVVRTEPRDAVAETYYHRFADALLPGRRALPASFYGHFAPPEVFGGAEYVLIVGSRPAEPPGRLLLETPDGSIWRASPAR